MAARVAPHSLLLTKKATLPGGITLLLQECFRWKHEALQAKERLYGKSHLTADTSFLLYGCIWYQHQVHKPHPERLCDNACKHISDLEMRQRTGVFKETNVEQSLAWLITVRQRPRCVQYIVRSVATMKDKKVAAFEISPTRQYIDQGGRQERKMSPRR